MSAFALLSRVRIADAGAQQDRGDDLEYDVLNNPVGKGDGVAEVPFLPSFEDVA